MSTTEKLAGKVAFVSGGAQGQGAAHVTRLAREGAKVHFGDIGVETGKHLQDDLLAQGLDVVFHELDVTKAEQWQDLAAAICRADGRLDILVNNAGVLDMLGPEEATEATWQKTIDVNQKGVFLALKHLLPLLRQSTSASVINTSSIFGLIGAPDYFAYTASKGAVSAMTKAAAMTYGKEGIRVNSIHPGYVDTPMLRREFEMLPEGAEQASLAMIPLGRFATAEDIAPVVSFLASEDSRYITGAELVIDGGVVAGR